MKRNKDRIIELVNNFRKKNKKHSNWRKIDMSIIIEEINLKI